MEAISIGQVLEFEYPRHNCHLVRSATERRRLLVEKIRDLTAEPLNPATVQLDPLRRRGRVLVTGQDLDKRKERSFYLESMHVVRTGRRPLAIALDGDPNRIVYEADDRDEADSWAAEWNSLVDSPRAVVLDH